MKKIGLLTVRQMLCLITLIPLLSLSAIAGDPLYSLLAPSGANGSMGVNFNISTIDQLKENTVVDVAMPSQQVASGVVKRTIVGAGRPFEGVAQETSRVVISLEGNAGSIEIIIVNKTVAGMILHDSANNAVYRAVIDGNGRGTLKKEDINTYQCFDFPVAPDVGTENIDKTSDLIPTEAELHNLESRPGAAKTLYINYWGGTISNTGWNDSYNSGNDIIYTPYDTDGNTNSLTLTERSTMWLGWQEVAEDYAAFDINVTTKQAVYDGTSAVNHSQIIATTTNYFYTGAGGVAYVGIFNNTSDYYKTGWAWNSGAGSLGMTISHEAGHQMGLGHDGTSTSGYYGGHGVWGPIMGAPFNQEYVQWSKGEYSDANNSENDLTSIAGVLGTVTDDAGDTNSTATGLTLPLTDYEGQITPDGLSADVDVYSLSLSGTSHIEVKTLLGDEDEHRASNLAMNVTLEDSSGTIIASMTSSDHSPLDPTTNILVYDGSLASDTYYLTIDAVSPDTNWTTGFGEYGNGGLYRLNVDTGAGTGPAVSTPTPGSTLSGASETFTWSANGANVNRYWLYVGTTGAGSYDILNADQGTATSATITGLPTDGSTVYFRFWFRISGSGWDYEDYTYTTSSCGTTGIISPTPGSTLSAASETFSWCDGGAPVSKYWLYVGSSTGAKDIYDSGDLSTATSTNVSGLPTDGSILYVRFWFYIGAFPTLAEGEELEPSVQAGGWYYEDYTYTAVTANIGFDDQFSGDISNWDENAGVWANASNAYLYAGDTNPADNWVATSYNLNTYSDLDYKVRLWREGDATSNNIFIRSDNAYLSDGLCSNCYIFQYSHDGSYSVWLINGSSETPLQSWTTSTAINQGGAWNDLRVIAQGSNLSFYINGTLVWTGTDSTYTSGRVGISAYKNSALQLWANWATLTVPGSAASSATVSAQQQQLNSEANENPGNYGPEKTGGDQKKVSCQVYSVF